MQICIAPGTSGPASAGCKDRPDTYIADLPLCRHAGGSSLPEWTIPSHPILINVYVREVRSGTSFPHVHSLRTGGERRKRPPPAAGYPRLARPTTTMHLPALTHDATQPAMLLYFPAENAAVSAVVLLCSCARNRSTQRGSARCSRHMGARNNREIRSRAIPISRVDRPYEEKGRDKRETHYRT